MIQTVALCLTHLENFVIVLALLLLAEATINKVQDTMTLTREESI